MDLLLYFVWGNIYIHTHTNIVYMITYLPSKSTKVKNKSEPKTLNESEIENNKNMFVLFNCFEHSTPRIMCG